MSRSPDGEPAARDEAALAGEEAVFAYHERTKHRPLRYAASPGQMDWANEPDPFRRYPGAPAVELPLGADDLDAAYDDLHRPGALDARPLGLGTIGAFFELALGLSAWKQFRGARWALRCNPSSGNLHPTEGYALAPEAPGVPAGLYHYLSLDHALERRSSLSDRSARRLRQVLPPGGFLAGLATIHWREAWKYGERAFRYCGQDTGHAIASLRYAAAALGWSARLVTGPGDADVAAILGLDRNADFAHLAAQDREDPEALLLVTPGGADAEEAAGRLEDAADEIVDLVRRGTWAGQANPLSPSHVPWPVIDVAREATRKPRTRETKEARLDGPLPPPPATSREPATRLIRRRRSAVDMDGETSIAGEAFYAMLDRLLPRASVPPWDVLPWPPRVHLGLFVHRVRGLEPGLYAFERADVQESLRAALPPDFLWRRPDGCPGHLRLFLLRPIDARPVARLAGCRQDIAADGAFSLGFFADFETSLRDGSWWYRRLHWEAGVAGQALYLEAEAAGVRATGMGCFFDDVFRDALGLSDRRHQDLYHFAVGAAVDDPRLTTLPPYADRTARRGMGPEAA